LTKAAPTVKPADAALFLALKIIELEKSTPGGRSSGLGIPYRFYVGIKTELFDFIEQNRAFDSLGEDLGQRVKGVKYGKETQSLAGLPHTSLDHGLVTFSEKPL
jgi:hypothetical protein